MWPNHLRHWPWSTMKVITIIFFKYIISSLHFRSLIESPGDLSKDNIALNLVWTLTYVHYYVSVNKQKLKDVPTPRESTTDARLPLPADRLSAVGRPTSTTTNLQYIIPSKQVYPRNLNTDVCTWSKSHCLHCSYGLVVFVRKTFHTW